MRPDELAKAERRAKLRFASMSEQGLILELAARMVESEMILKVAEERKLDIPKLKADANRQAQMMQLQTFHSRQAREAKTNPPAINPNQATGPSETPQGQ